VSSSSINIAIAILAAGSMQMLWKMLNVIQLILHFPLFSIAFPSNAYYFFSLLVQLANFKIIDVNMVLEHMFSIKERQQGSFSQFGY
jgi:hypothetical protein